MSWPRLTDDGATERVLLLGGGGWLGNQVEQALIRRNTPVLAADRTFFDQLITSGALIDFANLVHEERLGTVVNCIRPSDDLTAATRYALASTRLAEMCESSEVRLFHLGSAAEYGVPLTEKVSEDHPCRPLTEYARAKAAASSAVVAHGGMVIRPFNIVGPRQPRHTVVGDWVSQLRSPVGPNGAIRLRVKDPNTVRDFVPLSFVANVIADLIQEPIAVPVLNVCSGIAVRFDEVAESLVRHTRKLGAVVELEYGSGLGEREPRATGVRQVLGDPALLNSLGYRSQLSIEQLAAAALG